MAWLEITLETTPGGVSDAVAALTAAGFSELVIEDQQELEDFLEQNRACWDYIEESLQKKLQGLSQIRLYLEDCDSQSLSQLKALADTLGLPMTQKTMEDTDWSESWKDNYPPVEIGESLVILPYWLAEGYDGSRKPVILDPGLTFGTGAHPSTQMVIEAMEEAVQPHFRCLDLGSGSGILSIAALRLGAKSAIGVDIDPKAEDIARENAAYNGFSSPEFTALTGNVTTDRSLMGNLQGQYDLVLVNIVADVIIALAPVLPNFLSENSLLVCSGILDSRLEDVSAALRQAGLSITHTRAKEDWRCITAKRS